jgi:hypothetical protein
MKHLVLVFLLFIGVSVAAQVQQPSNLPATNSPNSWLSYRAILDSFNMFVERDTFLAKYPTLLKHITHEFYYTNGNGTRWYKLVDTVNLSDRINLRVKYSDTLLYIATKKNLADSMAVARGLISVAAVPRFNHDVVVNGGTGTTVGVWSNGQTIPLTGKRVDSLPDILATKCNHPSYAAPTASVSISPSTTSYEYGTNIGLLTLSSGFSQNNGGALTGTTYYQNGSPLGSNTTTISSLTSTQSFFVNKAYAQGACLNDNCGVQDCTGRINAGSVNSGTISISPFLYRYWGWVSTNAPSDATVRALTKDAGGLALTVTNTTPTGSQYFVYYHPTSTGNITNITTNGFPSTSAFTISTVTFVNAQGASVSYQKIVSNNALSATTTFVFQ